MLFRFFGVPFFSNQGIDLVVALAWLPDGTQILGAEKKDPFSNKI